MASKLFKDISLIDETITKDQLERFALSGLKDYCKQNSLSSAGTKEVVIKRILEHVDQADIISSKENGEPNLSESLEKMHVSKKTPTTTRTRKSRKEVTEKRENREEEEETEKETKTKKRGKGVQFHSQTERVHVFDRADPPAANIYDIFGNNKGAPSTSMFDEETRNIIKRNQRDDKHVKIATEGVASTVFSLHDVIGSAEVGRDTEELTLKELKEELKWRNASIIGTRRELIDRLDEIISGRPKQKKVKKDVPSWLTWD